MPVATTLFLDLESEVIISRCRESLRGPQLGGLVTGNDGCADDP